MNGIDFRAHLRTIANGKPAPETPELARPVTAPMAEEPPLSPSEVSAFLGCSARWDFKYRERLPDPKTGALALGIAFHAALKANFTEKLTTGRDLPLAGVKAVFNDAWADLLDDTEFREDEDPPELRECGEALLAKYMDEAAPRIQPAAVELPVSGAIAGVKVNGKIDLLDVDGRIIDTKTAAKKPSFIDPDYRFQIATYKRLEPRASGEARLDTVTKTKTVNLVPQTFRVNAADNQATQTLYPLALAGMRAGLYFPNRASHRCSRNQCPFWRRCEQQYGGIVKGGEE